jgi:hypothetical protein
MEAAWIESELSTMDVGTGIFAFYCYLYSLPFNPTVVLVTDGFVVRYGKQNGLYILKFGDSIFCKFIRPGNVEIYAIADQASASRLYDKVMHELQKKLLVA